LKRETSTRVRIDIVSALDVDKVNLKIEEEDIKDAQRLVDAFCHLFETKSDLP